MNLSALRYLHTNAIIAKYIMSIKYKEYMKQNTNHLIDSTDWINLDIREIIHLYKYIILEFYTLNNINKLESYIEIKIIYSSDPKKLSQNVIDSFQHYLSSINRESNLKDVESFIKYLDILTKLKFIDLNIYASTD